MSGEIRASKDLESAIPKTICVNVVTKERLENMKCWFHAQPLRPGTSCESLISRASSTNYY